MGPFNIDGTVLTITQPFQPRNFHPPLDRLAR